MNSKAQVKGKLGDVVQIHVCRLRDSKSLYCWFTFFGVGTVQ